LIKFIVPKVVSVLDTLSAEILRVEDIAYDILSNDTIFDVIGMSLADSLKSCILINNQPLSNFLQKKKSIYTTNTLGFG
jgi:hypothetical protein